MSYNERLESAKVNYPSEKWRELFFPDPEDVESEGMEQYTQENCDTAKAIFDILIEGLQGIAENGDAEQKEELFNHAIEALNDLNN